MNRRTLLALALTSLSLGACATPASAFNGIGTSEERRIWVIRTREFNQEVFRCADTSEGNAPPQPVCIRAALGAAVSGN